MDLHSLLVECAKKEGFPLAGGVDLDAAIEALETHVTAYDQWLDAGFSGAMEYLKRGRDRRSNPRLLFPPAQSIFSVAIPYPNRAAGSLDLKSGPRYARYLQGADYHLEITTKLEKVMVQANSLWTKAGHPALAWKVCVDTSAVLERAWAALAGLGWIGKNTLLIHPKLGSYLFLAEVLIDHRVDRSPSPLPNYCGHCTRCLDACPTAAFRKPRVLDSNRCISYWTLEKREELPIDNQEKSKISSWIAGCDICQEVCPFNRKATRIPIQEEFLESENATSLKTWKDLLLEDPDSYRLRVKNSALKRVKPAQFSRNLAMGLANALETASHSERLALISKLGPLIQLRYEKEQNSAAKQEWKHCIELTNYFKSGNFS